MLRNLFYENLEAEFKISPTTIFFLSKMCCCLSKNTNKRDISRHYCIIISNIVSLKQAAYCHIFLFHAHPHFSTQTMLYNRRRLEY